MKSILISIRPKYCELIASGRKTIEVRKTQPKCDIPFKCYVYCTKSELALLRFAKKIYYSLKSDIDYYNEGNLLNGKVIGEFVCDTVVTDKTFGHDALFNGAACMSEVDAAAYCLNSPMYGWHISDLKIYDKPKELSEFSTPNKADNPIQGYYWGEDHKITRPPQSWCYVEELEESQ